MYIIQGNSVFHSGWVTLAYSTADIEALGPRASSASIFWEFRWLVFIADDWDPTPSKLSSPPLFWTQGLWGSENAGLNWDGLLKS